MILNEFPNLDWVRKQSQTGFADRIALNTTLPNKGWPNVVLNVSVKSSLERDRIIAPFSLFMNLSGRSEVLTNGRSVNLNENTFCTVSKGEEYSLRINEVDQVNTFNIHFADYLYKDLTSSLLLSAEDLMEGKTSEFQFQTVNRSEWKNDQLNRSIKKLKGHYEFNPRNGFSDDTEYYLLGELLRVLLLQKRRDFKDLENIPSLKCSTRLELASRLYRARDFIHDNFRNNFALDDLSRVSCLSKFHLARSFKEFFGLTPHQYGIGIRLEKSRELLSNTKLSVKEIAFQVGYEESNSFMRLFKQTYGISPSTYRVN